MSDCRKLTQYDSYPQLITYNNQRVLRLSNYSVSSGTSVKLSCVNNFKLIGQETVTCNAGKWDFTSKPYCGDSTISSGSTGLSDDTKILIGVLVGVLSVVIIVILLIICIVESKIRRRRQENKPLNSLDRLDDREVGKNNPGYWSNDVPFQPPSYSKKHIPNTFSVPLQNREYPFRKPKSEPDISAAKAYKSTSLYSLDSDISAYRMYRPSPAYLPPDYDDPPYAVPMKYQKRNQSRDLPPLPPSRTPRRNPPKKKSVSSEPAPRRESIYVGNWIPRDSIKACDGFNERALLHGRDPFLWKKVDNNWGVHLSKPDVKPDGFFD